MQAFKITEINAETPEGKFALFNIGELGVHVPLEQIESGDVKREDVHAGLSNMAIGLLDSDDDSQPMYDGMTVGDMKRSLLDHIVEMPEVA